MAAAEFKARCLKVMDHVRAKREQDVFGCLAGRIEIVGDIESPVVSPDAWEALRRGESPC